MRHLASAVDAPQPSIAVEINAATKALHAELNRLIIEKLPYALPPSVRQPARYAIGIKRFAAIYIAIERELALLSSFETSGDHHTTCVAQWLDALLPDELMRTTRFLRDLEHLQKRTGISTSIDVAVQQEQVRIHEVAQTKPHVLVAYAWIMYMAVFSGGRYIRKELLVAGDDFWCGSAKSIVEKPTELPGFMFLSFDAEKDGEGLKAAFKQRLSEGDAILTSQERHEVVVHSQAVFQHCIDVVRSIEAEVKWHESVFLIQILLILLIAAVLWFSWPGPSGSLLLYG